MYEYRPNRKRKYRPKRDPDELPDGYTNAAALFLCVLFIAVLGAICS